ncbi:hypothetical protein L1049_027998 [Liquidambar formosana]|uniref:Uncharacterized protein n=1 Tax=Liquidambar formosana TaxID=63359 RepID=A0AAP0RJK7_LIQFO
MPQAPSSFSSSSSTSLPFCFSSSSPSFAPTQYSKERKMDMNLVYSPTKRKKNNKKYKIGTFMVDAWRKIIWWPTSFVVEKHFCFCPSKAHRGINQIDAHEEIINPHEPAEEDDDQDETFVSDQLSVVVHDSSDTESQHDREDVVEEEIPSKDTDSVYDCDTNEGGPSSPIALDLNKSGMGADDEIFDEECAKGKSEEKKVEITNFSRDEKFLIFSPPPLETKKLQVQEKDNEEIFGDSCTAGSTSKSSSEWRSSINYTEDPFSSSSRRSCPKWESYTMFQKYDEEMMFLDRISAQKLHETESLRSIQACPRSISERIVHKLATRNKRPSDTQNPYHELETAYVAQICLTWEALNWNYKNFQRLIASRREFDPGCPGHVAQQFQQFQVLLQRYIENEPYEHGRRPEIYARMRILAPKLLQVPEYKDSEDDQKDEGFNSRISSASFLMIMEEGIRTFMNFLKADREKPCQILKAFFKRNRRVSVDPTLLQLMKKANNKKQLKLKDLRRARKCLRKIKLKGEEEMEILMGLIDLKVVSRVLRMNDITEEQLHWCEDKMNKVRVWEGKLQRDSSPLFFPAH